MKTKLSEQIFEQLKQDIVFNRIHPGEMLGEHELCAKYSVSRTPVRQALQRLENLGLIEVRDGVGSFVTMISEDSVKDAYEIRCSAEKLAAKHAIDTIPAEALDELEQTFLNIREQLRRGGYGSSFEQMVMADWKLHDLIVSNSGNALLEETIERITLLLRRCQFAYISQYERATEDHLRIIKCLKDRDYDALCRELDGHLRFRPQ